MYDGRLVSEPTAGRPALVIGDNARGTAVERFRWHGEIRGLGRPLPLDGLNRVPGLIRNCGGTADDLPTAMPLHDVTCTDADELDRVRLGVRGTDAERPGRRGDHRSPTAS